MKRTAFFPACILLAASALNARALAAPKAEHLQIAVSQPGRTWSLRERVGSAYRTLLRGAHVRAVRADGSEVAWESIRLAPDGHSFLLKGPDVSVKVLAQWIGPESLPSTLTLLPVVYASKPDVALRELRVVDGALLPTLTEDAVAFENGYQSWSATTVRPLEAQVPLTSWWTTALHSRRQSCVAGYLSSVMGLNSFTLAKDAEGVTLSDRSDLRRKPIPQGVGGTPLDGLYLAWGKSPSDMLAEYAAATRVFTAIMDPGPTFKPLPIPQGWCSWYDYYGGITEDEVLANTEAAKRLFTPRAFHIVQIDDGYQKAAGDWDTNAKFPRGHRWMTDRIHASGYKAGLWLAPFAVGETSTLYKEHPDWLVKRADGTPFRVWDNAGWGGGIYVLDPSLPPVRAWLRDLFRTVTHDWGYDYVKIDFLYLPLEPDAVMGGDMTPVEAYRAALKAIRQGCGPDTYILGCGAPIGPTIGLVNGNRIGPDVGANWPGIVGGARNTAMRQWMHNVFWQNDPDALIVRDPLTLDQARAWTAAVALSGGLVMLSDNLTKLPDERVALDRMALPVGANGKTPPFGPRPPKVVRATGMRLADMWVARPPEAPALTGDGLRVSLLPADTTTWRFHTGDDPAWAAPDADDAGPGWRFVPPGVRWENFPGLADYDGYAWYRVRFKMPSGATRRDMTLLLGRIDDTDETFVNGQRVGASGTFPPNYQTAVNDMRRYTVPADALRWEAGAENVVAIRVYDGTGDGGLVDLGSSEPPALWRLPSDVSPARITVAGLFNWGSAPKSLPLAPADLAVVPRGKRAHLWDVWNARYLGTTDAALPVDIPPTGCRLLAITPDVGHPQVLGTDADATSGAASLVGVSWNAKYRALKGRSKVAPGAAFHLALSVPKGTSLFRLDAPNATVERLPSADGSALFRITPKTGEVAWTARYTR